MSSMFKKKGGPAFKPKIPSARSRPVARPAQPTLPVDTEPTVEESIDTPSVKVLVESAAQKISDETTIPAIELLSKPGEPDQATTAASPPEPAQTIPNVPPASPRKSLRTGLRKPAESAEGSQSQAEAPGPPTAASIDAANPTPPPGLASRDTESSHDLSSTATPLSEETSVLTPTASARSRKAAVAEPSVEEGGDDVETTSRPRKRQRKAVAQDDEAAAPKPRQRKRRSQEAGEDGQALRRRRARSLTPEDAETQTVDLQKLKMSDLTKDLHIGKKFSRHDELRERERQKRLKAKLDKNGEAGDISADGSESLRAKEQSATPSAPPVEPPSQAPAGPQFRIVDGQIVVDQNSLSVDRHARAAAARAGEDMETIEENDFTRLITSNSFMNTSKLKGPNVWTEEETVLFYRGLAMFGTDFEIISKMIPGKQRRHVKLKFNREERHCPRRVNAALVGEKTVAMDLDEYRAATGAEYESVEVIEAEQKKIEDGYEAERQRIADEQAEVMRKKKEELFADEDVDMAGVAQKKKKKKKGKKQRVEYGLNGEPIGEE